MVKYGICERTAGFMTQAAIFVCLYVAIILAGGIDAMAGIAALCQHSRIGMVDHEGRIEAVGIVAGIAILRCVRMWRCGVVGFTQGADSGKAAIVARHAITGNAGVRIRLLRWRERRICMAYVTILVCRQMSIRVYNDFCSQITLQGQVWLAVTTFAAG